MTARTDCPLIMMVAQEPFETLDMNKFCKLIPIAYVDGTRAAPVDFPNDGEIWWMLTAHTSRLAVPGLLVVGRIELAVRYKADEEASSQYQAIRESIQDLNIRDGLEVITIPGDAIESIQEVVARGFQIEVISPPAHVVMLYWRSHYYGPFTVAQAESVALKESSGVSFAAAHTDGVTVYEFDPTTFDKATKNYRFAVHEKVSLTGNNRSRSFDCADVSHDILIAAGYDRLLATNPKKLVLEPIERKLLRLAKDCLNRPKRQQLKQLLEELDLTGRKAGGTAEMVEAVRHAKSLTEKQEAALGAAAEALLQSGLLGEDRIKEAEKTFALKYVEERTAELQANVEMKLTAQQTELRGIEEELKNARTNLQKERAERREALEQEIATERKVAGQKLTAEKEEFERQKAELERQQSLLKTNLQKVTYDLREAGDDVVNKFLTIAPLLGAFGLTSRHASGDQPVSAPASDTRMVAAATFNIPAYLSSASVSGGDLKEQVFFDRFKGVVENSGFTYRLLDLQRFHLSIKCGEITVLGGPSGTGKSSLPALYAQALLGIESSHDRPGCLMVNINPSWMDTRDLLGHMNTLDGRFYPAESGLYRHLVFAQKEHETRGRATGMYLTCLDEMNLSQVEHYFSDFMMVLERSAGARKIQCFSPEAAGENCCFRDYGVVSLSPALRFIGTVNFDETTRLLSDRFLDRVNLIRLTSAGLPSVTGAGGTLAPANGPMVTLADFEAWQTDRALPTDLGSLLDQMRPLLSKMGCPISPRAYRGICRFVGSAGSIMSPEKAFEVQVAQRIIPRIRSLVTNRQLDGLDEMTQLLKKSNLCTFDESIPLLEEIRESMIGRKWELEK